MTLVLDPTFDQLKRVRRGEFENMKDAYWAKLVADNGGMVVPGTQSAFNEYCTTLEGIAKAMFAEMDAIRHAPFGFRAVYDAIGRVLSDDDRDALMQRYYRWSEANFGATGRIAGIQYN
jgi:hypothetical protein